MSDTEKGVEQTIERASVKPTKRQRLKASCKKYWWAWLIAQIIMLGIIAIIGIFGIIPRVAQDKVNDAGLNLHSLEIRSPTPNDFRLSLNSSVHIGHGISTKATLDPMVASLYIQDKKKPFMKLQVPKVHGEGDVPIGQTDVLTTIDDVEAMDEFASALMKNVTLKYKIYGRTKLWLAKIHTMVNYNQKIEMAGLNELSGMHITNIMSITNQTDGATMHGNVTIPNPTIVTIEMGDVALKVGFNGTQAGTGVIPNLVLRPGNNSYYFRTMIPGDKLAVVLPVLTGKDNKFEIGSTGTFINGVKIPWLSKPLEAVVHQVPYIH